MSSALAQIRKLTKFIMALVQFSCLQVFFTGLSVAVAASADQEWFSLNGQNVASGNPVDANGMVHQFNAPVLQVKRTTATRPQGTILLLPGGAYRGLELVNEGVKTADALNRFGFDVVTLQYHVGEGDQTRDFALQDALTAWRMLKKNSHKLHIHGRRLGIMGYSAGGHLAARTVQALAASPPKEQPDDLVLIYPAYLDECAKGSTVPLVGSRTQPKPRLITMIASNDNPAWVQGSRDYTDAWIKSGGQAIFYLFKDGGHGFGMKEPRTGDIEQWPKILNYFLQNGVTPGVGPFNTTGLPWFIEGRDHRLAQFETEKAKDHGAVVFLGDSITEHWEVEKYFPNLKTANRGISGDTTRGMLYRLKDNVLDLHPRAIVFLGGINDTWQQPQGTPQTVAANVRSILEGIRHAAPRTPVFVCEVLPTSGKPDELIRAINTTVDDVLKKIPNAHRVRTHDLFLNADGTLNASLFNDGTHPSPAGYAVWQAAVAPELDKLTSKLQKRP